MSDKKWCDIPPDIHIYNAIKSQPDEIVILHNKLQDVLIINTVRSSLSYKPIGGAVPPPPQAQAYSQQQPPQANPNVQAPQPYGVIPGIPTSSPYVIPGQTQLYPQGPPPTYDQALTHPALVGQHMYPPGTMYAAGYPTYLGYPAYTPMQYYPSLGAYSYAMQPTAQLRPTIMIPNGYDAGARFDGIAQQVIPPAPPGVPPSAAQLAAMAGHQVALGQKKNTFLTGGSDGGYTFW